MVSKVFEKLVDRLKKCGLFSDFQYDFRSSQSTADLLTIVPDRTASAFDRSRATRAVPFYISKAFDSVCMLVYFTNVNLMEFQVRYLVLFLHLSVIDGLEWFWMESLHKNIQLMLEFLKGPFLVIIFSYCILITFLMMLSVILLSMLMILLSIVSVTGHLICGNNLNWLLNLNLIYKTLSTGARSGLLISVLGKLVWTV